MINTVLLAIIAGMMIGKWVIEPLIDIYNDRKTKATFDDMWSKDTSHYFSDGR